MDMFKKYAKIVALVALGVVVTAVAPEMLGEYIEEIGKAIVFIAATTAAKKIVTYGKDQTLQNKAIYQYALERTA